MKSPHRRMFSLVARSALALLAIGCGADSTAPSLPGAGTLLVLNTYGETGVTVVSDTGFEYRTRFIPFGAAFDGSTFTVRGDTAISASSRFGGDLLSIADVEQRTVLTVQLPAASNPAGAIFLDAGLRGAGQARFAVALRDSNAVALVTLTPSGPLVQLARNAGQCPYDVAIAAGSLWSIDANEDCRGSYASLGPVRAIRLPLDGAARDTVALGNSVRGAARVFVLGDRMLILASGDYADTPGSVTGVDARTRTVVGTRMLPAGIYGTTMQLGADGNLYVTASGFDPEYSPRVYSIDPQTLEFRGDRAAGKSYLDLRSALGAEVRCDAATADADGVLFCVTNASVTSSLIVFPRPGPTIAGPPIRAAATGSIASDIVLR